MNIPRRQLMRHDARLAGLADGTKRPISAVGQLAARFRRATDLITERELRQYLLDLEKHRHDRLGSLNISTSGITFSYIHTVRCDPVISSTITSPDRDHWSRRHLRFVETGIGRLP
jgi:hypothetical protein